MVFLPRLDLDAAVSIAERLRRAIAGKLIRLDDIDFGFTISIGLVACGPDEPLEQLINRADEMLYEAKLQGRDRLVTIAADPAAPIVRRSTVGKRSGRPPARQRTGSYASQACRVCSEDELEPAYLAGHLASCLG